MLRLLYVTSNASGLPRGGRALLSDIHGQALQSVLPRGVWFHRLERSPIGARAGLTGWLDGVTPASVAAVIEAADRHAAQAIWLDGSNLGRLAQGVRHARPHLRLLTFCHNVEARFFLGALRRQPRAHAIGVLVGNIVAERLAMRYSHDIIALSHRDSNGFVRLYGRPADHILPMAVRDQPCNSPPLDASAAADAPFLFVGGAFYANQAGIAWYARHVAPRVRGIATEVVGLGMGDMRAELVAVPGMRVVGPVGRLGPRYRAARVAIAPIFDGSGMKTKVAEALMYGKRVIGTPEAFSGYAEDIVAANWLCTDADAFVAAITKARRRTVPIWDVAMRNLYERDHSPKAVRERIACIFGLPAQTSAA